MRLRPARAGTVLPSSAGVPDATPLLQTLVAAHFACRPTAAWPPTEPSYTPYKSNRDHLNCARSPVCREAGPPPSWTLHAEPAGLHLRPRCPLGADDQLWSSRAPAHEVRWHVHLLSSHSNEASLKQSAKSPRGIGISRTPHSVQASDHRKADSSLEEEVVPGQPGKSQDSTLSSSAHRPRDATLRLRMSDLERTQYQRPTVSAALRHCGPCAAESLSLLSAVHHAQ